MVALTHHKNGQRPEVSPSVLRAELNTSNIRNIAHAGRKLSFRAQTGDETTPAELHMIPTTKVKRPTTGPSESVVKALIDDGDPAIMLAELRDVLFGPTRKLQEARLEELVVILEQIDREAQATHRSFADQLTKVEAVDLQLAGDLQSASQQIDDLAKLHERDHAEVNTKLHTLAERLKHELLRSSELHKQELAEQSDVFAAKLEKLSELVFRQMEEMSEHQKLSAQVMANDFNAQLRELALATKTSDDKIRTEVDARLTQLEVNIDDDKRRTIKVLSEGLGSLTERLHTL
jgi:hypothetical protein